MKKTKFSDEAMGIADKMVNDYANLERNLRELRTVLAAICFQQDDKSLTVPFASMQLPAGVELEVSVDREHDAFQFHLIGADGIYLGSEVPERTPMANAPPIIREEPCEDCPAMQDYWNYTKEPDPSNPADPWRIKSWFECSNPASSENVVDNSALTEGTGFAANDHVAS